MKKHQFDVVIVGAGMVGLTLANLLARSEQYDNLSITVIDAGKKPTFVPGSDVSLRVSAIASGSAELFAQIDVWDEIVNTRACPYQAMRVWDAAGNVEGPETLCFDAAEFAVPQLGFIAENVLLQVALLNKLQSSDVSVEFETPITSLNKVGERFEVELGNKTKLKPDLLIGADGAASFVRSNAGIGATSWLYSQTAFVTHLQPEQSHRNTAWQRFLKTGPVGLLPLADGRVSTVWSTTAAQAAEALQASDEQLSAMLTEATDNVLGHLKPAGPRGSFPLKAQHADHYVLAGLALVGDAAHAVHPLAGQGANLGLADAETLASVISDALAANENPGDLPLLRNYERARKGANKTMLHFIDGLNRLFSNDSISLAQLRGTGMRMFNSSGPIRERAVQVALGLR
jgi:2-octaprenylphenol hydroxylase